MRIIVQKFGGTSVATPGGRTLVAHHVKAALAEGRTPVVVVSAMGRQGDPYATDSLLQLAASASPATAARELDLLMSCGEIISAVVNAATLQGEGISSVTVMTGWQAGIVTDESFGDARILRVEPDRLLRRLEQGETVVVAGFQGASERGEIATLGRGGSDTTAVALGIALQAEEVHIFTDVDGIKTADPRLVADAHTLRVVNYEEVMQMASLGSRVIHPRAVELAMQANLRLRIRNTFVDDPGTLVTNLTETPGVWSGLEMGRPVTGVTQMTNVCQVAVLPGARQDGRDDQDVRIFRCLAESGISVDLINVSPDARLFTIHEEQAERAGDLLSAQGFEVRLRHGCAKVSVVGMGMRGLPGVMARVVEALYGAGVTILQTADSHVTISCLVDQAQMQTAVQALHGAFGLGDV